MAAARAKADDFVAQAEKRLNGWALFNKQAKVGGRRGEGRGGVGRLWRGAKEGRSERGGEHARETSRGERPRRKGGGTTDGERQRETDKRNELTLLHHTTTTTKFDDAADLYKKAANQYRVAKEHDLAGAAYEKAGRNAELAGNPTEAMMYYMDAGKAFAQESAGEAIRMYTLTLDMQRDSGKFTNAAKTLKIIGGLYEADMRVPEAIRAYSEAAELYQTENSQSTANQLLLTVADLQAGEGNYADAIDLYQRVAASSLESALTKWSVSDYYFKASICSLVRECQQSNECKMTEEALDNYVDSHPAFQTSREFTLMKKLLEAYAAGDVQEFTDALFEYNQISPLDAFKSNLLVKVKRRMVEADNDIGEGAGGGEDDDVPDFT